MSQYDYSVKEVLTTAFGENAVSRMRRPLSSIFDNVEPIMLVPLCWQYADKRAVDLFLEDKYLIDTVLTDDYIAYIIQKDDIRYAYLMYMLTEEDAPFRISTQYALSLFDAWKAKGFEPRILSECVGIEYYGLNNTRLKFVSHSGEGKGAAAYRRESINGKDFLVFDEHPCWAEYSKKLVSVSQSHQLTEYECLFDPDVEITRGTKEDRIVLSEGIPAVKELLEANAPVLWGYREFQNTGVYSSVLLAGDTELIIYANRRNLISEIRLGAHITGPCLLHKPVEPRSLRASVPSLLGASALAPPEIHGFALRLRYSDDSVRYYYIKCFEDRGVPDEITVNGFKLTRAQLGSVSVDEGNGVSFDGGFAIPAWRLFYQSYRQLIPEPINDVIFENKDLIIKGVYRAPLTVQPRYFGSSRYRGRSDECFGPAAALLDESGKRLSAATLYSIVRDRESQPAAFRVRVEPTEKYGFIKADGSWLAPPVYTDATELREGCAEVKRSINGKSVRFLLTASGKEKPIAFSYNTWESSSDRFAFSAEAWVGAPPDAGLYWDFESVYPGKWGFIDSEGTVVIKPQYVFAVGFYDGGGEHSVVAKYVDGVLRWGVIDRQGNETIPCAYSALNSCWGEAVTFQTEKDGQCGLMDFDGSVIVAPSFGCIDAIDKEHGLITAGEHEDALGVYSIKENRMITPCEYDSVDYGDRMIVCEPAGTCDEHYYDYKGNLLDFSEYDSVCEDGENLRVQKNGKFGLIDWHKNVIIPPIIPDSFDVRLDQYKKGLVVVGEHKLKGVSTVAGKVILPQIFSRIVFAGDFIVGSVRTDANWCECDTLFTLDGTPVLKGPYRHIEVAGQRITAETPRGVEHYIVQKKKPILS